MTQLATTAPGDLWKAWSYDPLVLVAAVVSVAFFVQGWRRLRGRRKELAPWSRLALFLAGVTVVLLGLVSPLDAIAEEYLQSAHMLQHVLIADVGVALAIVAVRGPLSMFFVPRDLLAPLARVRPLRRTLSFLLRPRVAVPLWLCVLVAWHLPPLYEGALRHPLVHSFEHLSFVVVGVLVWALIVDPARHGRLSLNERIGVVIVVFWVGQVLSYPFVFGLEPYYQFYVDQPVRLFGLSALTDQRLAGLVMMVEQGLTMGVALVVLVRQGRRERALRRPAPAPVLKTP